MNNIILYSAKGSRYVDEACKSGHVTRSHLQLDDTQSTGMLLCTDQMITHDMHPFDQVIMQPGTESNGYSYKISSMIDIGRSSPGAKVLFIDTDAAFIQPKIDHVFRVLDYHDVAAAHAQGKRVNHPEDDIPESYVEYNTGLLAFRCTDRVIDVLQQWFDHYHDRQQSVIHDQPDFRKAIYQSDLRVATLPPEWNVRTKHPYVVSRSGKKFPAIVWHHRPSISKYK